MPPFFLEKHRKWQHVIVLIIVSFILTISMNATGSESPIALTQEIPPVTDSILTFTGEFNSETLNADSISYINAHSFEGKADEVIALTIRDEKFDVYVTLKEQSGKEIGSADFESGKNFWLVVTLPFTGEYTINTSVRTSAISRDQTLPAEPPGYELLLRHATEQEQRLALTSPTLVFDGELSTESLQLDNGRYYSTQRFWRRAREVIVLEATSDLPDVKLILKGPLGTVVSESGDEEEVNPKLSVLLPVSGDYKVLVHTSKVRGTGNYQLGVRTATEQEGKLAIDYALNQQDLDLYQSETYWNIVDNAAFYSSSMLTDSYEQRTGIDLESQLFKIYQEGIGMDITGINLSGRNKGLDIDFYINGPYTIDGLYAEAEALVIKALLIMQEVTVGFHVGFPRWIGEVHGFLDNLGWLYNAQGHYDKAASLYETSLSLFGNNTTDLGQLAEIYWNQSLLNKALIASREEWNLMQERWLSLSLPLNDGFDRRKRDYFSSFQYSLDRMVTLHLNHMQENVEASQIVFKAITQHKGRLLDLFSTLREQISNDSTAVDIFDELNEAINLFATLSYGVPPGISTGEYLSQLRRAQVQVQSLESQLNIHISELASPPSPDWQDIQAALPNKTALVEFVRYHQFEPGNAWRLEQGPARYAAYILFSDGTIQGIDLGMADKIDEAVSVLKSSLASPYVPSFQLKQGARIVDNLVMSQVRQALGDIKTVFLIPDEVLNLIPFEVLVDESNSYLVKEYKFRYLTSSRDLIRIKNTSASNNPAVLMGAPAFSHTEEENDNLARRTLNLEENHFPFLPGTEDEIIGIAQQLLNSNVHLSTFATEAQLKSVVQPSILHIATHGFFIQSEDNIYSSLTHPLLQSGLVLAGVRERKSGFEQDGILTSLEVTGLNLHGTQLVVLSACETGLGEVTTGEGLYGLRRALVLAGSQSQVISLWKVDDTATQELMVDYYDRLLSGSNRDAALRETQLAFLNSEDYSHPYYWAAFIGSGDWRPLQQ